MKSKILIPLAGVALFCSCSGVHKESSSDSVASVATAEKSVSAAHDTTADGQTRDTTTEQQARHVNGNRPVEAEAKLVKTADIRFKVKNVAQTTQRIAALTTSLNGTVVHHFINSTTGDSTTIKKSDDSLMRISVINTTGEMTVKIPPANMETFLGEVAQMGVLIKTSRMDISDKSLEYLSTKLKDENELAALKQKKNAGTVDADNELATKNRLVDQQMNNRRIDDSVKNSVVVLSFYESSIINRETIANADLTAYSLPASRQLATSFANGWGYFVQVLIWLANLWVLFPLGIGAWLGFRYYNRRKKFLTALSTNEPSSQI